MLGMDDGEAEQFLERIKVGIIVKENAPAKNMAPDTFSMCLDKIERTAERLINSPFTKSGNILSLLATAE